MKLQHPNRFILRLRRQIHKRNRFKEMRNHGGTHHAELMIRLERRSLNPPTGEKIRQKLRAKLEYRRQIRVENRNERYAARWMKKVEENEESTEMAGLFALERALTFLSFFARSKMRMQEIRLFLLCGGEEGMPMRVASDMTGINYKTIWAAMKRIVELGFLTEYKPGRKEGDGRMGGAPHLEVVFPFTNKGWALRADLAKFDTRDFARLFELMQGLDPIGNVTVPRERLHTAIRCSLEEMQSKLTLDW